MLPEQSFAWSFEKSKPHQLCILESGTRPIIINDSDCAERVNILWTIILLGRSTTEKLFPAFQEKNISEVATLMLARTKNN